MRFCADLFCVNSFVISGSKFQGDFVRREVFFDARW